MVVWFITIAVLGRSRGSLRAARRARPPSTRSAVAFFADNGWHGFAVLGAVLLVVTGGEALYADMGHFGKRPIRLAWFALVLPALLLNYFGQGALLLRDPTAAEQPFFLLAPAWALFPLVGPRDGRRDHRVAGAHLRRVLADPPGDAARLCPRLDIEHTSSIEMGQVYVPQVNWALMVCTIAIVIGFGSSTALAAAYGIAVTLTMVITAMLLHVVDDRALAVAAGGRARRHRRLPGHRPGVLRRQRPEGRARRLAAARHRRGALHADDDVEDRAAGWWRSG